MDWPNVEITLSSWDVAMVVQSWLIYKMVVTSKEISRTNIRIALVYFLGPSLLIALALRVGLNIFQG